MCVGGGHGEGGPLIRLADAADAADAATAAIKQKMDIKVEGRENRVKRILGPNSTWA